MTAVEEAEYASKSSMFNLGQLLDDVTQQITDKNIDSSSKFNFIWHNIQFAGQLLHSKKEDNQFTINLVANLGYLPFSSENNAHRKKLIEAFTPQFMKGDYIMSQNSQIQMVVLTGFTGPVNAKRLVEVISITLLDHQAELKSIQASILG